MAIPSGEIYLLRNVPLTASYEHTIDFKDKNEQLNYFLTFRKYTFDKYTYIRKEREFLTFELPISSVDDINYMLFRSADGERLYYAFVGNKRFINNDVTEISFEIDVMQTYMFDYKFNASYIRQAHVDRWTAEHKPIYSKTDEGLDYGTEYAVESAFRIEQSEYIRWLLVSVKDYSEIATEGFIGNGGSVNPAPSPFNCFLVPLVLKTDGTNQPYPVNVTTFGSTRRVADYNELIALMNDSAFGTYVQSVNVITYLPFIQSETFDGSTINVTMTSSGALFGDVTFTRASVTTNPFLIFRNGAYNLLKGGITLARDEWNIGLEDSMPTTEEWDEIKNKPYTTKRDKRFESKLLCAPYRYNLLTDWRNNPVVFKNEYMTTDKIVLKFSYAFSYNAPFRFWLADYKKDPEGRNTTLSQPIGLEFPVVSDAYYTYMLQNKNTIQANLTNALVNAGTSAISGAISGAVVGGVPGAIFGGVSGAVSGGLNVAAHIRNENAKQSDLKTVPDTLVNSLDSSFNILDGNAGVTFYRMRICCENEEILAEIFNMTGYKVNRVEVPNLRSRTRFNYIQTVGANITGSFSQTDIQRIKNIFDNGITIWHYNDVEFKPYDYSYENLERNLL